jgi:hypothetical protein
LAPSFPATENNVPLPKKSHVCSIKKTNQILERLLRQCHKQTFVQTKPVMLREPARWPSCCTRRSRAATIWLNLSLLSLHGNTCFRCLFLISCQTQAWPVLAVTPVWTPVAELCSFVKILELFDPVFKHLAPFSQRMARDQATPIRVILLTV